MQVPGIDIMWVVIGGTAILLVFATTYIFVLMASQKRVLEVQRAKLEEVKRSEEKYRHLFDNSLVGIMRLSVDTLDVLDSNDAMKSIFGCNSQEALQDCIQNLPATAIDFIRQSLSRDGLLAEHEIQTRRRDGSELWILFSAKITPDHGLIQSVVADITQRKYYEEKIKEQSALLDQTHEAIILVDYKGRILFWNSGAEMMYGWSRKEASGQSIEKLLYDVGGTESYRAAMEDVLQFNEWNGEQHHQSKTRNRILVESRWKTIETKPNGQKVVMIVESDVTEKKKLESQYVRAQRMESIALLTGGLAHDLQNILAPVNMSIDLLKEDLPKDSKMKLLKAVEERAQSGLELVKNILTYGKGIHGERVGTDVNLVVEQVLDILTEEPATDIRVKRHHNGRKAEVLGDPGQLKQVFMNLCVNAREAMASGGVLTVDVSTLESDESLLEHYPNAESGPYVVVTISDTGKGIDENDLDKIFEPFFTTREGKGGTGLGLSIVQGIVRSHNGFVTVESKVGKGSTFRVYLPAASNGVN